MSRKELLTGAKAALPICLGLIPIGISYGLLALQAGLTRFETVLMSVLVMAGSSQLMVVGMIGKATVLAMVTAVFFVNLRHLVMSSAVMSRMEPTPLGMKLLSAFSLCDESFALFSLSSSRSAAYLLGANTALSALIFPGVFSVDAAHPLFGIAGAAAAVLALKKCPLIVCVLAAVGLNCVLYLMI